MGEGAAIGAGAGAAAGIIGVLLTRGRPTYITPEQVLTFRVENPIVISTDRAPQAFRYVGPGDYQSAPSRPYAPRSPAPYYGAATRSMGLVTTRIMDTVIRISTDPASESASVDSTAAASAANVIQSGSPHGVTIPVLQPTSAML